MRLTMMRAEQQRSVGTPGPEGSLGRLMVSEHQQHCFEFIVTLLGAEGMLISDYEMRRPEIIGEIALGPDDKVDLQKGYLSTIGGTNRWRYHRDLAQHPRRTHPRPAEGARPPAAASPGVRSRATE